MVRLRTRTRRTFLPGACAPDRQKTLAVSRTSVHAGSGLVTLDVPFEGPTHLTTR